MHSYTVEDETISQSEFSPCYVESEEDLLRLGYHPQDIDEKGKIAPKAITTDDLGERGFSVDRKKYCNKELIKNRAQNQRENCPEKRQQSFISIFSCSSVRVIKKDDNERAFIILDTADQNNIAHASIYGNTNKKSILREIRVELAELLNKNLVPLNKFLEDSLEKN